MKIVIDEEDSKMALEFNLTKIIKYVLTAAVCIYSINEHSQLAIVSIGIIVALQAMMAFFD